MYSRFRHVFRTLLLLAGSAVLAGPLAGCSLSAWWDVEPSQSSPEASTNSNPTTQAIANKAIQDDSSQAEVRPVESRPASVSASGGMQQMPGVEIVWQVPSTPVEVYHINYGYSRDQLRDEITVPVDRLEKIDHPAFGPVFRYFLRGVSPQRDIFVSMKAENRLGLSSASEVIAIPATSKRP